jgi:hypothetical protein
VIASNTATSLWNINLSVNTDIHGLIMLTWMDNTVQTTLSYALADATGTFITPPMYIRAGSSHVETSINGQGNAPLTRFGDVPPSFWSVRWIEALADAGVTSGCGNGMYCPAIAVTRAQMAVFLLKAKGVVPQAATGTMFADVPATAFAASWIEELAREGITSGCGNGNFCPDLIVTRDQMAVFLLKAKGVVPQAATGTMFVDVPLGFWAGSWIEELARQNITGGCGGGQYCPGNTTTRDQMAVFLVKAFNLPLP